MIFNCPNCGQKMKAIYSNQVDIETITKSCKQKRHRKCEVDDLDCNVICSCKCHTEDDEGEG